MAKKQSKDNKVRNTLIVAGLFIGIGLGMITGHTAAGTLIGLGAGYLAYFIYTMTKK